MKVRCVYTSYKDVIPSLDSNDYSYSSILHLAAMKEYIVYSIVELKADQKFKYLIVDETGLPDYRLSDLFEIVDAQLPLLDWHFSFGTEQHAVSWILGYDRLANDYEHFEGVILHDEKPLEEFWKWKKIVDRQYFGPEEEWETVKADIDGVDIDFKRNRQTGECKNFRFL